MSLGCCGRKMGDRAGVSCVGGRSWRQDLDLLLVFLDWEKSRWDRMRSGLFWKEASAEPVLAWYE